MEVIKILELLGTCVIKGSLGLLEFIVYIFPILVILLGIYGGYTLLRKPIMKKLLKFLKISK